MNIDQEKENFLTPADYHSICQRIRNTCESTISLWKRQIEKAKENVPTWEKEILGRANEEFDGMHILPGTDRHPFFVGNPPKWKEQRVTDKEYLWGLNRTHHWNDFITAYYLTGERRFGEKIKEEALDWINECIPPDIVTNRTEAERFFSGVSPWRTLETGIRMFEVWPNAVKFLVAENFMDRETLDAFLHSFYQHGRVLYHIPPILWPDANHNHYLMENLGLFYMARLFPEIREAEKWGKHAFHQLERCVYNQLTEDGAQIEGCPTYHNVCMCYFCLWLIEAKKSGISVSREIQDRIRKGLDYSLLSFRPGGGSVPFGDSDVDYEAVRAAILGFRAFDDVHWLAMLHKLSDEKRYLSETASCVLEWEDAPVTDLLEKEGTEKNIHIPLHSFQRQIQQVSYRTSWEKDALQIQYGCRAPVQNGHAHIDPHGFDFSAFGKPMLTDPGRYTYDEAKERKLFKSATMHNCLVLDGKEPYEYLSSWEFGKQHDGAILKTEVKQNYFWAHGIHTCYFPIIHERIISLIDHKFLLVWDELSHIEEDHTVDIYFHIDREIVYKEKNTENYFTQDAEGKNLYLRPLCPLSSKKLPGFASDRIDQKHPSVRIVYEDTAAYKRKRYAFLAIPYTKELPHVTQSETDSLEALKFSVDGHPYQVIWNGVDFSVE